MRRVPGDRGTFRGDGTAVAPGEDREDGSAGGAAVMLTALDGGGDGTSTANT